MCGQAKQTTPAETLANPDIRFAPSPFLEEVLTHFGTHNPSPCPTARYGALDYMVFLRGGKHRASHLAAPRPVIWDRQTFARLGAPAAT